MTVAELIGLLQELPQDYVVARFNHATGENEECHGLHVWDAEQVVELAYENGLVVAAKRAAPAENRQNS